MIYSASRRTDLPAYYPDYICQKVQRSRKLQGIVFWTKDPRNFINHFGLRAVLSSYPSIINFTLTGLAGSIWEPNVPDPSVLVSAIKELATLLPAGAIRWRFDPIIVDDSVFKRFNEMHSLLLDAGVAVENVTLSFPDIYKKVQDRLKQSNISLSLLSIEQKKDILKRLYTISGLKLQLCCEDELLDVEGVEKGCCVDGRLFTKLYATDLSELRKDRGQRAECGCMQSTDIGSYDQPCPANCLYCYACPERDKKI